MNRRTFLGGLFGSGVALAGGCKGLTCGGAAAGAARDPRQFAFDHDTAAIVHPAVRRTVRFTVITDSHFALIDGRDDAWRGHAKRTMQWPGKEKDLDLALERARKWGAEVVMLTGDMFSFPSYANVEFIERKMKGCGMRWVYIAGNHDWHFEGVPGTDNEQRAEWIKRLAPLFQGADPLMSSYEIGGVRFVSIDDSTYQLLPEQVDFLRAELAKGDPTCLFMHIPLYLPSRPNVFTVGSPTWGEATDTYWQYENRQKWAKEGQNPASFALRELAFGAPNMVGIFAGHEHTLQVGAENGIPQFVIPCNYASGISLNVELRPVM